MQNIRERKIAMTEIVWMQKYKAVDHLVHVILYDWLCVVHVLNFVCYRTESNEFRQNFKLVVLQLEAEVSIYILMT